MAGTHGIDWICAVAYVHRTADLAAYVHRTADLVAYVHLFVTQ
jgi:hypothetical protein